MCIWLMAAEHDNAIEYDPGWIKEEIHAKSHIDFDKLFDSGWLELWDGDKLVRASKSVASCYQCATSETETETEKETDPPTPQGERREGFAEFLEKGVPEGCDPLDANPLDPGPGLPNKLNQEAKWEPEDFCEEAWAVFRELEKLGSVWLGCVRTLHRKTGKTLGQIVGDAIKTHGVEWTRTQIWDRQDGYFYAKGLSAIKTPAGLAGTIYQRNTEASLSRSGNSETDQDRAAQRMADEILGRKSNE